MSGTKRLLLAVAVLCLGVRCIIVPSGRRVYVPPPPSTVVVAPQPAPPARTVPPPPPAVVVAPPPAQPPPPAPMPPPPPRTLSEAEAVNIGQGYCQSHNIPCDFQEAHLTGNGVWKVKFKVRGPGEKGHVHIDLDAQTGKMLHVDEKLKGRGR